MAREQSKNELKVISAISLVDYYNKIIVPLDGKYTPISELRREGLCPFHTDTDPSLHYWKQRNIFHCFGCGFGGDVVKTHIKLKRQYYKEKLTVDKAVEQLASIFGIELDIEEGFVIKSPFEIARERLFDKEVYQIPKGTMSIAEFRQLNNKIKRSNLAINHKIANFENLDLIASASLSNNK